jgi:hypothetical protein
MKATDIFGKYLRDMMSYVGWVESENFDEFYNSTHPEWDYDLPYYTGCYNLITKAHTFLSQPNKEEYFVRPDKPEKEDYEVKGKPDANGYRYLFDRWLNWTPMFKGEWKVVGNWLFKDGEPFCVWQRFKTLNDFATHCASQGIKLELHEEFELK